MKKKILLLPLLLLSHYIFSETFLFKAVVKEKGTELPVISATIKVVNPRDSISYYLTNTDGEVEFNVELDSKILIRSMGFKTLKYVVGPSKQKEFHLEEDYFQVEQVVVTASRNARLIKESPVITQVIPATRLVSSGFSSIESALMQEIPGLNFQKVGFGTDINVSGLDARHILFLIDGERLTGEMAGNLDYQRFNLHSVDRVEIVKGASSTLYGSRAAGAVINMITKKTNKPFEAKVGVRYGQMNQTNYDSPRKSDFLYMYEKNVDRPNLQAWISLGSNIGRFTSQTDVIYSSSDAFYLFQAGPDVKNFPANPNIGLKNDTTITSWLSRPPLGIEGNEYVNASQKFYFDPTDNLSIQLYGTYFFMNTYDLIQDLQFSQAEDYMGGVKFSYKFDDYAQATFSLHSDYYNRYKRQERYDTKAVVYDSKIIQPRIIVESTYFKKHNIMFGVDYYKDELTSDRFKNNKLVKREKTDIDYFLQDEYAINKKITVVAGFRSSYNENYGTYVAPKFALKYAPTDPLSFRFNYAAGYRSPSIKELYFNWDHLGMFQIVGDEYLQPENNNYFSFSSQYATSTLFLSANVYANYFTDKIEGVWRVYNFQYNFEYRNLSESTLKGAEILGRIKLCDPLILNFSYAFVNVTKVGGVKINTASPHTGSVRLEYRYQRPNYKLTANMSVAITGKKEFSVQDRLVINGKSQVAFFDVEIPTYSMCNLSVTQKYKNSVEFTVGVENFLNYKPETLGAGVTMFNVVATAGRRFFVQVDFTLDQLGKLFN